MLMEMIYAGLDNNLLHNSLFKIRTSLNHSIAPRLQEVQRREIVLQSTLTWQTSSYATVGRPYCNSFHLIIHCFSLYFIFLLILLIDHPTERMTDPSFVFHIPLILLIDHPTERMTDPSLVFHILLIWLIDPLIFAFAD